MKIAVEALDDGITCISLAGSLDIESAQKIDPQMAEVAKDCQWLVVDLMHVDYLASFGIRTLISTAQAVQKNGGKMVIANPQEMVEDILRNMVIDKIIPLFPTRSEAAKAVKS